MLRIVLACFMSLLAWLQGCAHANDSVGMTLLFTNKGPYSMGVSRFDPDGQRGPTPGALGVGGSKQMSFMAGDSKRGVPQFVEVEWSGSSEGLDAWWAKNISNRQDKYSKKWNEDYKSALEKVPKYTKRIDLTPILTPELLAQVRANRTTTHLMLTVVFKDDNVSITAKADVWRK